MNREQKRKYLDAMALDVYRQASAQPDHSLNIAKLLTTHEQIVVGRRLLIAHAIMQGKTRRELEDTLGISPNTFAQINRWLESEFEEYKPSTHIQKVAVDRRHVQPFSYQHLKKKYPMHFALFSIAEAVWKKK